MTDQPLWEIVGGGDKGGLLVRPGQAFNSGKCSERLATGSIVEELEQAGDRLHYKLVKGSGPTEGWVALSIDGKILCERLEKKVSAPAPTPKVPAPSLAPKASSVDWDSVEDITYSEPEHPPENPEKGSRWNPRYGEPPSVEAPYGKSTIDVAHGLGAGEIFMLPQAKYSMKGIMTVKQFKEATEQVKPGSHYGIIFPHNFVLIREAGPTWLTKAFHRAGTLPANNKVISLEVHELSTDSCAAESMGGQGMKGWLKVEYEKPHPQLHTELFVKLPFPYSPQNERLKNSYNSMPDETEIILNRFFGPVLPYSIPKYYFGEFCYETTNYILISEKLKYKETSWAEGGRNMKLEPFEIEPRIVKFKDYEMPRDGFEQYAACMQNLGRMAAVYHRGGLGSHELIHYMLPKPGKDSVVEGCGWENFRAGVERSGNAVNALAELLGGTPEIINTKIFVEPNQQALHMAESFGGQMVDFIVNAAPKIFPDLAKDMDFLKKWWRESMEIATYTTEISMQSSIDPKWFSLLHCNLAADNAWYWRGDDGVIQAGLLDFGGSSIRNVPANFQMSWMMAEPEMLRDHWEDLLHAFVDGCQAEGGPAELSYDELRIATLLGFAQGSPLCGGNVMQLMKIMKKAEWNAIPNRWDPKCNNAFLPRNYTCAMRVTLSIWKYFGLYDNFIKWKKANDWWLPSKPPFVCPEWPIKTGE